MVCHPLRGCSAPTVDLVTLKEYTCDSVSFWQQQGLCFPYLPPSLFSFLFSVSLFQSIPGWLWTYCVTHDDLKLLIVLPPPPRCWGCRCAPSFRFSSCWEWTQCVRQALHRLSLSSLYSQGWPWISGHPFASTSQVLGFQVSTITSS